jgi:hypothetical protein
VCDVEGVLVECDITRRLAASEDVGVGRLGHSQNSKIVAVGSIEYLTGLIAMLLPSLREHCIARG